MTPSWTFFLGGAPLFNGFALHGGGYRVNKSLATYSNNFAWKANVCFKSCLYTLRIKISKSYDFIIILGRVSLGKISHLHTKADFKICWRQKECIGIILINCLQTCIICCIKCHNKMENSLTVRVSHVR